MKYLLDVNVLIALTNEGHLHDRVALEWFHTPGLDWGVCAFSEAGFLRISTHPRAGSFTVAQAAAVLTELAKLPGYRYWPNAADCETLMLPFRERVFGHQQTTDAILLGLAVREDGVLVTMDKGIQFMAGAGLRRHVLVLG